MSKRKLRCGETRPLYRDRYNAEDAATYRPRGTKERVRRQMESEATYATAADAIADMRRMGASTEVLCDLLRRIIALEAEQGRLGEDVAQLDAAVEAIGATAHGNEVCTEALRADLNQMASATALRESVSTARLNWLEKRLSPQTSTPESDVDDVLTIGGRRKR